jgi:hypothetical protein
MRLPSTPLPYFTTAAVIALLALPPEAAAQFWAKQPGGNQGAIAASPPSSSGSDQTQPESEPAPPPDTSADDPAPPSAAGPRTIIREPNLSAPPAPGSSLGGSGETGTDSVGILPARDSDFDRNTWRYTSFSTVLGLMQGLPDRIDSAAQHELAKNLLVSIADAPQGDDGKGRLLSLRVRKLFSMGDVADAAALARAEPDPPSDPELARTEVDAELMAGQIESACIDLRSYASLLTDPASQNALTLCQQRAGETATDSAPMETASLGAAARIVGVPVSVDLQTAAPPSLVAVALDPVASPEAKLESAFAAGRASALYGEFLAKLFAGAPAGSLSADGGPPADGAGAAALYQAIAQEGAVEQRVGLAERGLLSADGIADKVGVAMVSPLRKFEPVPELGPVAARMAILFYTVDDIDAAAPWAELADSSGSGALLWPYRVLIKQAEPGAVGDWQQAAGLDPAHQARVLTILSAFGAARPPKGSARVAGDDRPEAAFGELLAIDKSAKDLHVGETVLRALAILGRGGPANLHPLALRRVLADLDQVSLHGEAHALAFEAITAALYAGRATSGGALGAGP